MMGTKSGAFSSVEEFRRWCAQAPSGTQLDAGAIAEILASAGATDPVIPLQVEPARPEKWSWREKLWTVPAETRLGVTEAAEALGRPKSFIYDRTRAKAEDPIPHRKLDSALVFTAGELRAWIRDREEEVVGGPMESTQAERRGFRVV